MMNLDLENKTLKLGKTTFNTDALAGMSKDDFIKIYTPILKMDMKLAWRKVSKYCKVEIPSKTKKSK